ncbi:MAG: group 1 glycosyl transferase [Parcubacteria group bacterium Gr01-1014_44]|nr:MAG: group 1 glycosyl transferase [Parcubacteria group bacterium Gr01-1014_44]
MSSNPLKKIALVHDWLLGLGGAERTLKVLHEMFPQAPIYTFFYNKKFTDKFLPNAQIRPSFIQKICKLKTINYKLFLPLLPIAAESFDLSHFNLVISSSIAFSKGLILKPKTKHICYCYSPTRFLWDWHQEYLLGNGVSKLNKGWGVKILQHFLRIWDRQSANRVDQFVAISKTVQQRIKKYYGRDSIVIYPPVTRIESSVLPRDIDFPSEKINSLSAMDFVRSEEIILRPNHAIHSRQCPLEYTASKSDLIPNYYLIVSRLFPHKNIDIAIRAFNKLELPLIIIGAGPEYGKLKKIIENKNMIKLLGEVPDTELGNYYADTKAFIMPQEEDFGMTPLEAMAFGKPVLALRKGGALEYVLEGINGEFFDDPHPAILADGVRRLNENYKNYSPLVIKKTAERFSRSRFEEEIKNIISK